MERLIFLPIDIDIDLTEFHRTKKEKKLSTRLNPYWDSAILDDESILANSLAHILGQLPFSRVTTVMHKYQTSPVGAHYDIYPEFMQRTGMLENEEVESIKENEPCGYRMVIKGTKNALAIYNGSEWVHPELPSMPSCYLIDSTRSRHKVNDDPGRELLYFRGIIDKEKHKNLIERSLQKYGDMALYLKSF